MAVARRALHDFLAAFHDEAQFESRPVEGAWIPDEPAALRGLTAVDTGLVERAVSQLAPGPAPLDLDATIIAGQKRHAHPHDKSGRRYQPTAVP